MKSQTRSAQTNYVERIIIKLTHLIGVFSQRCEKPVVRCDKQVAVFCDQQDISFGANARINNGNVDGALGEVLVRTTQPKACFGRPMRWNVVGQIYESDIGKTFDDSALHYRGKRTLVSKIRRYCDYPRGLPCVHGGHDTGKIRR